MYMYYIDIYKYVYMYNILCNTVFVAMTVVIMIISDVSDAETNYWQTARKLIN